SNNVVESLPPEHVALGFVARVAMFPEEAVGKSVEQAKFKPRIAAEPRNSEQGANKICYVGQQTRALLVVPVWFRHTQEEPELVGKAAALAAWTPRCGQTQRQQRLHGLTPSQSGGAAVSIGTARGKPKSSKRHGLVMEKLTRRRDGRRCKISNGGQQRAATGASV
ncbi:hypothetical protein ACJRO7_002765, partial [Eucalyptus globulus]